MAKEGLYKKLTEVLAEVERIPKRGRNEHFKYDYVMEADLVDHIRPILAKKKIVILPSVEETAKEQNLGTVKMRFRFIDAETGDFEDVTFVGQGQDPGDKAFYKAYTGAMKYVLMKTFLVATGDDPEQDENVAETHDLPPHASASKPAKGDAKKPQSKSDTTSKLRFDTFWASVKNLGFSEDTVHDEAAAFFNISGLKSLNEVPGLDTARLNKFLQHLVSLKQ